MVQRNPRPGARPVGPPAAKPAWPADGHSGEGSASALEALRRMEKRRVDSKPAEPRAGDEQAR